MNTNRKMTLEEKYNAVCNALNSISDELEMYKKALKIASQDLHESGYLDSCPVFPSTENIFYSYLKEANEELQKARENSERE